MCHVLDLSKVKSVVTFAHYLALYDNGEYAREVESGDIHTSNQKAAGLETRDQAKTFVYGLLYGGGDAKVGEIVKPDAPENERRAIGRQLKNKFNTAIPAYAILSNQVKKAAKYRGWIKGLDGRKLMCRSAHSALNLLLQSAGSIIMKQADIILWQKLAAMGYPIGCEEVNQVLHYHDEIDMLVREDIADEIGKCIADSITEAAEYFNLNCKLEAEYKVGDNWYDIH
jgi:DNA polymerase-1